MTYLDKLAQEIHYEVEQSTIPNEETASLFRLYAVLLLAKGDRVTAEDVHNAWSAWMIVKDPQHQAIKPFTELSDRVQDEDQPYVSAIRQVARRISSMG